MTYNQLIDLAEQTYAIRPSDSQIGRMLKKKDEYLAIKENTRRGDDSLRMRAGEWPEIDQGTDIWFEQVIC